jgi:hypothetical protein
MPQSDAVRASGTSTTSTAGVAGTYVSSASGKSKASKASKTPKFKPPRPTALMTSVGPMNLGAAALGGTPGPSELGRASAGSGSGLRTTDTLGPNGEVRGSIEFMDVGRSISGFWNFGAGIRGAGRVSVDEDASAGKGGRLVRGLVPGLMRVANVRPSPPKLHTAQPVSALPQQQHVQVPMPVQAQMQMQHPHQSQVPARMGGMPGPESLGYGPVTPMSSMQHPAASTQHFLGQSQLSPQQFAVPVQQHEVVVNVPGLTSKSALRAVEKLDREARIAAVIGLVVLIVMVVILATR